MGWGRLSWHPALYRLPQFGLTRQTEAIEMQKIEVFPKDYLKSGCSQINQAIKIENTQIPKQGFVISGRDSLFFQENAGKS